MPSRDLPDLGIELVESRASSASQADSLLLSHPGSPMATSGLYFYLQPASPRTAERVGRLSYFQKNFH